GRHHHSAGAPPAPAARSAAHLRRDHSARVVPGRGGSPGAPAVALDLARACRSRLHLLVSARRPGAARARGTPPRCPRGLPARGARVMTAPTLTMLLQGFFTDRLGRQLQASPATIAAYRDSIRLLLLFASQRAGKSPVRLVIEDLDAVAVGAFLDHLEHHRHNSTATRNARLAAVHSFFRYALPLIPDHAHTASQVLAIPPRRYDRAI